MLPSTRRSVGVLCTVLGVLLIASGVVSFGLRALGVRTFGDSPRASSPDSGAYAWGPRLQTWYVVSWSFDFGPLGDAVACAIGVAAVLAGRALRNPQRNARRVLCALGGLVLLSPALLALRQYDVEPQRAPPPPPPPTAPPDTDDARIEGGTMTMTQIFHDGGTIGCAVLGGGAALLVAAVLPSRSRRSGPADPPGGANP